MEVLEVALRSLAVSSAATALSLAWSVPMAARIASARSRVKELVVGAFNAMVGFPTVLVGLLLYMLFSRSGPLGFLGLLYTPQAIAIGQALLITPLLVSLTYPVFERALGEYWELAVSLGASRAQAYRLVMGEVVGELAAASLIAFARAIGELGVALLVGGNIRGVTRVLTTAIALEVERGNFALAMQLGATLLALVLSVVVAVRAVGARVGR